MTDDIRATRLGDILIEKGLLNASQLREAVDEQQRRRQDIDPTDKKAMDATSIGEILIGLGYITRQQLKRGLNWQMYLRKMTLVMTLCAPLMSIAGGAHAASSSSSSSNSSAPNTAVASSNAAASSAPSIFNSATITGQSYSIATYPVNGRVILKWDVPRYREDGGYLDITELGGYELRYRKPTDKSFTYVSINDPWKNYHQIRNLVGDYIIEVAAFDKNGLYSKFVPLPPS